MNNEIKTVVVDDEPLARQEMRFLLREHQDIGVVAEAKNGIEAVEAVRKHAPDLLFLDIQMPGMDGFGVIRQLLRKGRMPHVVFVTAFDEYAIKAFEVNAVDYLLKPVDKKRLAQATEKVRKAIGGGEARGATVLDERLERLLRTLQRRLDPPRKLTIKVAGRIMLVDPREVVYAAVEEGVITVVTDTLTGTTSLRTLEELHQTLPTDLFWRAHRSHLLNINRIREVLPMFKRSYYVKMNDPKGTELPVARAQVGRLREMFGL